MRPIISSHSNIDSMTSYLPNKHMWGNPFDSLFSVLLSLHLGTFPIMRINIHCSHLYIDLLKYSNLISISSSSKTLNSGTPSQQDSSVEREESAR